LWAWRRGSRVSVRWLLGGAILLHILVLFAPLPQSQDFYQYLFYGRMQAAHGANPYLLQPSTFWADNWFPWIRWSDQTSVYGPVWMLVTWGVAKASLGNLYGAVGILLHLALVFRERGWRALLKHAAAAMAVIAAAYMKYWAGLRTFGGLFKAVALTDQSLTGTVQRLLVPLLHDLGVNAPQHASEVIVRVAAGALLAASVVWALVRVRDERSLWYCALVVLAAYLYLTPWFLYWYTVAPLAMIAVLPRNRLTYPMLVFSGSSMFIMGHWAKLENWVWQTLIRYVPPIAVFARSKSAGIVERRPSEGS